MIEDLVPIYDTQVILNVPETIKSVGLIPDNVDLKFVKTKEGISIVVPKFKCHTAVVFEY